MGAGGATLSSRLRVLVAKTFRAEKLYGSMRRASYLKATNMDDVANDIRARVWLRCHKQLRTELNEVLELANASAVVAKLASLKQHFEMKATQDGQTVEKSAQRLTESASRHEFAHCLKLSMELVELKARSQANKVVADEISELLRASGRAGQLAKVWPETEIVEDICDDERASRCSKLPSNVIPLRRAKIA